jgi:acyl transferase domain-containing protein/thioesterase domain-containing protein
VEISAIAVVGMSGRFPGASGLKAFWKRLSAGAESVRFFTDEELRAAGEDEATLSHPHYVKACSRLDDVEMFDAAFFGMSARDAAMFDPQHRFFLECAWEAFETAGYVGESTLGPVGVFASCGMNEYLMKNVMTNAELMTTVGEWLARHTGNDANFLATRVSYELNLRGPSVNVQTACSSSLAAIHLACQSLLNGECDLALAGGSTIYPQQNRGYLWKEGEIFSRDGHTRSFDANAAGTTMASATACIVLKRLADAERDGDNVLAVIRGSALNNDGHDKVGYFAPSVSGQARVVKEALEMAGVSPDDISYVEAHGTATPIGDPIEVKALTEAFRTGTERIGYCAIGSLKSCIGHAGEASGAAAFVKTVLALQNRQIPPSLNFVTPNPHCEFASSPFFVNTTLQAWDRTPRIAGVTSLGIGGTNCHVVVEEAPPPPAPSPSRGWRLLVLSARTQAALEKATENFVRHIADDPGISLADAAFTLAVGRKTFRHRRAIVACSVEDAVRAIATKNPVKLVTGESKAEPPPVMFLFPKSDAPLLPGVAREIYESEPVFKECVDACLSVASTRLKRDLRALMFPAAGEENEAGALLGQPSLASAALLTLEYAMAKLLASWAIVPTAAFGEGAGECAAAAVAGILSFEDALALAVARGARVGAAPVNASPEVECSALGAVCRTIRFDKPRIPVVSASTATWMSDVEATDPGYWSRALRGGVGAGAALQTLRQGREPIFVEVGPGRALSALAARELPRSECLGTMRASDEPGSDVAAVLATVGRLWTLGVGDPGALHEGQPRRRVPLPTYPWQRQRYWLTPGRSSVASVTAKGDLEPLERPGAAHAGTGTSVTRAALPAFERPDLSSSFVAPRTTLERELADMWRELLGVEHIGVRDDFFELGGQSLVAVRFFSRIRKKYGIDLPISTLLEAPSIEQCARILVAALGLGESASLESSTVHAERAAGTAASDLPIKADPRALARPTDHKFRSLVLLQGGTDVPPFFCVHGAGGNVLNFRDLSQALGPSQPFYGLQARGVDGVLAPHETIEEMAAAYLEEIRSVQPHGPYMLGGYSGGGVVALEMARGLTEAGEAVDLLALIDTFHPTIPLRKMTLATRVERLRRERLLYVRRSIEEKMERRRARRELDEAEQTVAQGRPLPPELRETYLIRSFNRAWARYRPQPWKGRAILFRAEKVHYIYGEASEAYGWEEVISDLHIAEVPGNHHDLLLGPHASVLIAALARAIEQTRQRRSIPTSEHEPVSTPTRLASGPWSPERRPPPSWVQLIARVMGLEAITTKRQRSIARAAIARGAGWMGTPRAEPRARWVSESGDRPRPR